VEENPHVFTKQSAVLRRFRTKCRCFLIFDPITRVATILVIIILGALPIFMRASFNPGADGARGLRALAAQTEEPLGCAANTADDRQAESVRLAGEATTLLQAEGNNTELATLLGICALQTAYTPEGDEALQRALDKEGQLPELQGHTGSLFSAQFSPDGQYILTSSWDGTARLWNAGTLQEIRRYDQPALVLDAKFSPDGHYFLTTGNNDDPNVRLWETETGNRVFTLRGHSQTVFNIAFSPDGQHALSAAYDGSARLWDLQTGEAEHVFEYSQSARWVSGVAFSPDGRNVIIGNGGQANAGKGLLEEWSLEAYQVVRQFTGATTQNQIWDIEFSPDGRYMLVGTDNGASLWDYQSGDEMRVFASGTIWRVAFSPDARYALGVEDGRAYLWDIESGQQVRIFVINANSDAAFTPDGRRIATTFNSFSAKLTNDTPPEDAVLYDTDINAFIAFACTKVNRDFSDEERTQYGLGDGRACR
jgi:WD40 repeat protein